MTKHENLDEYVDPTIYDQESNEFEPDGPFYLALAQRLGGAVLELGCGTGRVTIPLAQQGIDITGLDLVRQMLRHARRKARELSVDVNWIEADIRSFRLGRRFSFVFESGATFQHLLTRPDQEAMLARVREHLVPDGRLVLSTIVPTADLLTNEPTEQHWFSYTNVQGRQVRVSGTERYDPIRQVKTETAYRRWQGDGGREIVRRAPLMQRYVFPQELEALLHYNGFAVTARYGDWDESELTDESRQLICVCCKSQ
jgi:SAM-dependent methyltransferase